MQVAPIPLETPAYSLDPNYQTGQATGEAVVAAREAIGAPAGPDAILVLGRGIHDGELTQTGYDRVGRAVVEAAIGLRGRDEHNAPLALVFSGGHSWRQDLAGQEQPVSEGEAMLRKAQALTHGLGAAALRQLALRAETTSISTVENMVNSKDFLGLEPGALLSIVTDNLHLEYGRVQYLARLVFGKGVQLRFDTIDLPPEEVTTGTLRNELLTTIMTKLFMTGVRRGDGRAIMRRQHALETCNAAGRTLAAKAVSKLSSLLPKRQAAAQ